MGHSSITPWRMDMGVRKYNKWICVVSQNGPGTRVPTVREQQGTRWVAVIELVALISGSMQ